MDTIVQWFQSNAGMGLLASLAIFLGTLFLAGKRYIGLLATVILMGVAAGIGWLIANR